MDSPSTTAESKHNYQSAAPWSRISTTSTPRSNSTSLPESSPVPFPIPADLLALLTPQTSSYQAQVQAQLLQYNKLISPGRGGGGGLQSQPPLPTVTSPHTQAPPPPRSRSSSKVSNKDSQQPKQPGAQSGHGNRARKNSDKPDRAVITGKDTTPKMPPKQADHSHNLPSRPAQRAAQASNPPAHSSSVPSTPHQHARNFSFESREPSPNAAQNHSPRSAYSETNGSVPSLRPLPPRYGGCIYETAFVPGRRRMPYSIGSDRLESVDPDKIKSQLPKDVASQLDTDMRELYDRLQPTPVVEDNRQKLVQKLERIFNEEWSGHNIRVNLFGSSGNLLCSDDSDVDICITTEWKELEGVCIIADLLKKRGMEKVVCVSSAKVPIVKIWDPELGLACDMNVNNTLALENTRMVRTYVEIDPRIRPLAMIIKYWTRRRLVNDAAFGGTLSSYTWICMIIVFLQLRDPPVVPALHQRQHQKMPTKDGHKTDFADDLNKLRGYGDRNKSSLGELLFQFFRFYAHEFDYDKWVLSIRLGKTISKTEKKWHLAMNNMLCVEEPFNTARNLGNTADDTSFRGLHMELRRAFDMIAEGKLEECCEQYVFPKEEENTTQRVWQKPAPRPAILRSSSQQHSGRGGRGNYRGNRHFSRNGNNNNNRRASSSQTFENSPVFVQTGLPPTLTPQDIQWYQAQQAQYPFQGDVFGTLNALQMQEHSLRFQLYTQQQFSAQQQALAHAQRMQGGPSQSSDRSRTNSFDQPPLTAPIRPEMYVYGLPLQPSPYFPQPGFTTYPSSPSTTSAAPEFRRSLHRTTVTSDSGNSTGSGSLRSQSQPATRTSIPPTQAIPSYHGSSQPMAGIPTFPARHVNGVPIPSFIPDENADSEVDDGPHKVVSDTPPDEESSRYIGYYVNDASSPARKLSGVAAGIPAFGDLGQNNQGRRRLSTDQLPQSILDRRMRRTSRSPSPLGHARAFSMGTNSAPLVSGPFQQTNSRLSQDNRPLVVNGSAIAPSSTSNSSRNPSTSESRTPDETGYDNPLHINQGQIVSSFVQEPLPITQNPAPAERPLVVNGSNQSPAAQYVPDIQSFGQRMAAMNMMNTVPFAPMASEVPSGRTRMPDSHNRQRIMSRQQQNVIAPLDLAIGDHSVVQDLQHLSPVYETRTPSPTVLRRFENSVTYDKPVLPPTSSGHKDTRADPPKSSQKSPVEGAPASTKKDSGSGNVSHPRVNGISRENGHVRSAKSESDHPSGWQKPKSRKKQADLKNVANGHPQGEQPPKNEADRKGG